MLHFCGTSVSAECHAACLIPPGTGRWTGLKVALWLDRHDPHRGGAVRGASGGGDQAGASTLTRMGHQEFKSNAKPS